jgi:lysophospholipase L1-like esterase
MPNAGNTGLFVGVDLQVDALPPLTRLLACLLCSVALLAQGRYDPGVLPKGRDYFALRDGLANAHLKFTREKTGRVAFLGGSITAGGGWREHTIRYFQQKFPDTAFEFISAGIPSMGSVPHAFRLERDVLANGPVDLLFVEAAVNDSTNTADPAHMRRGMEGVVRHARAANPLTDIVHLHFVMPEHMADYEAGRVPASIAQHEAVAAAYGNPSLNLAREVTDRIAAGQFTWAGDFKDLHPSPFGHQLYAHSIARMLDAAFSRPQASAAAPHTMPAPLDPRSYARGRFGSIDDVRIVSGFTQVRSWHPSDGKGTRAGFVDVPALVGTEPGATFTFTCEGTAAGLLITAGPDTGRVEFSIDGSAFRVVDTFTQWSPGLHLPWAVILDDGLAPGRHEVTVRIAEGHDARATGTALRVFQLLLN